MRAHIARAVPSIVDLLSPEAVLLWIPDALVEPARGDVEHGRVARPRIQAHAVASVVADEARGRVAVRIAWGVNGPEATCTCGGVDRGVCRHAAALGLMLIGAATPGDTRDEEGEAPPRAAHAADREREVRRARGASDLFEVRPFPGTRVYGRYEVSSPSARAYEVTVRALDELHNGCTCPDLATNLLGTCKHIEAVLHRLRRGGERRFAAALKKGPPTSYLHLSFDVEPVDQGGPASGVVPRAAAEHAIGVRLSQDASPAARRLRIRHFAADGRLAGPIADRWPDLLRDATDAGVEVPREVATLAERARDATARAARLRAVEAEVRAAGREQPGVRITLYPYQVEGVAFLASRGRALLADEMGLGKTAMAIAAMVRLVRREGVRRTLVVCPASLKRQWQREIERFTDLPAGSAAVVGGVREERRRRYQDPPPILITSYELARADEANLVALAPDLLVLDEAQRIKNWRTRTADAVKRIPSRHAFVLTGTPLENRLDDLYSLVQVVDPHLFGPLWRFNEDHTDQGEGGRVRGYKNLDRLRARVAPVMLRRRKEDVALELPSRIVNRLVVPMTEEQQALHDDGAEQVRHLLGILRKRPLTPREEERLMRAFQRMRMACDAAGLVDKETRGAPKLDELGGLLEELCLQGGHKVVVFSEWEKMQAMAAEVCEKLRIGHVRLHGGVPSAARGALIDRFLEDPSCLVFFSTDAGGTGLNLQAASHLVNLDLPWNPAVLAQRLGRIHRIGQKRTVNVVLMVSENSFEERLEGSLDAKRALFAAAVGDDVETTEIARATLATRMATLMQGDFAATTGAPRPEPPPPAAVPEAPPANDLDLMRAHLGDALERVVRLPDGRLLGVLHGAAPAPALPVPAVLLSKAAADALAPLGDASPLAQAEVLYRADAAPAPDPALEARRTLLAAAERKLAASAALIAAGMGGEALALLRAALALGCRAAADDGDPGEDGAALLGAVYGRLIPRGLLTEADAHALTRAGELARAFGAAAASPPEGLVASVEREARDLLARVRERLAAPTAPAG